MHPTDQEKYVLIFQIKGHKIENIWMSIINQSTNKLSNELIATIQRMNTDKSHHAKS